VQTPGGRVTYEGDYRIDGVPGGGAPIVLNFLNAAGAKTGKLLPTGAATDLIAGVEVSCVDLSSPLVFVKAASMGKTGYESKQELDADAEFLRRLEAIRLQAGILMGLGDVSGKVLPKIALVARPVGGGTIASRYFVPWSCHSAYACHRRALPECSCEHSGHRRAHCRLTSPR
jgi:2-methylaconitate cis-trans-isomerase PrpF